MNARLLLRSLAVSIAVLAIIDPSCTRERRDRPIVAIVGDSTSSSTVATQRSVVRASLASRFIVVDGALPTADAVVLLGEAIPAAWRVAPPTQPVIVATHDSTTPFVRWRQLRAPSRARVGEVVTLDGELALGNVGDSLVMEVRQGDVVIAREVMARDTLPRSTATSMRATISVVPVDTGAVTWDVRAELWTARGTASATRPRRLHVHETPVRVSGIDVRPSWAATFARRVLAADERIDLTTRVAVSRLDASTLDRTSGRAPMLGRLPAPPTLDVLVLGAAQALSPGALAGLDRWVRDDGGSVVVMLDDLPTPSVSQWLGVASWRRVQRAEPIAAYPVTGSPRAHVTVAADARDSSAMPLRGREWLVPTTLPTDADTWLALASTTRPTADATTPVVWARARGRGTVVVIGALDAWTFREAGRSDFARTWRDLVVDAAARRAPDVELEVRASAHASGWMTAELDGEVGPLARWRDAFPVFTLVDHTGAVVPLPTVGASGAPLGTAWRVSTSTPAPSITLTSRDDTAASASLAAVRALVPVEHMAAAAPTDLATLAVASGGAVVPAASLATLDTRLDALLAPAVRRGPWHPWRSPWWLLPFTAALLGEWWWRRRLGQP
ncbi:MAG: hypothetical protein MUD17_07480 [Gemmatimonadaceae bacterium]|jgi:hypothetical protein|nr:hypothetical protein [Gemmatimonadaceae bacterium]